MRGAGEPPVPGTSKRTTSMAGSRASTKGWSTSRLTPIPFTSSSGVRVPFPERMATRRRCPLTVMVRASACGLVVSDGINHSSSNITKHYAKRTERVMARTRRSRAPVFPADTARCQVPVVRPSAHRSAGPAILSNPPTRNLRVSGHWPAIVRDRPGSAH